MFHSRNNHFESVKQDLTYPTQSMSASSSLHRTFFITIMLTKRVDLNLCTTRSTDSNFMELSLTTFLLLTSDLTVLECVRQLTVQALISSDVPNAICEYDESVTGFLKTGMEGTDLDFK